ncbi:hypothetical protein KPL40_16280 [Clostridium gasigenes]|uniref:hypothetical protein n=1 Tax=Clostridium gasigenes TaxID=94869 RepID=UPI001C0E396E|nr:hypothetical protein [Clostridium gasigenes]MBU3133988.1 hypothetical protein [Clostridium gasigenes]
MKTLKTIFIWILSLIFIIIFSIVFFILLSFVQSKLFLPEDYILWIFKFPISRLIFIYELYIIIALLYFVNKNYRELLFILINFSKDFIKNYKTAIIFTFVIFNIILTYAILFNVTVITNNKIIDYTFLSPTGKEYEYNDIVKIDTGVYGKKLYLPFTHSKGDFYYIIELKDGTKIDLNEVGSTANDIDYRFILENLDKEYVNMDIPKVSSMDNFEYCTEHLDKIYTDKIRNILLNTK